MDGDWMRSIQKYCQTAVLKLSWAPTYVILRSTASIATFRFPFLNEASADIFAHLQSYSSPPPLSNAYLDTGIWVKTANHTARIAKACFDNPVTRTSPVRIMRNCLPPAPTYFTCLYQNRVHVARLNNPFGPGRSVAPPCFQSLGPTRR